MQTVYRRVKMVVHLDFVAVKFEFGAVKQSFVSCKARHNLVNRLNEVDDVEHCSVRHTCGDVARNRVFKRGTDVREAEFSLPSTLSAQNIAVALHHDFACAEHVGKLANALCVCNRLFKRLREGM